MILPPFTGLSFGSAYRTMPPSKAISVTGSSLTASGKLARFTHRPLLGLSTDLHSGEHRHIGFGLLVRRFGTHPQTALLQIGTVFDTRLDRQRFGLLWPEPKRSQQTGYASG